MPIVQLNPSDAVTRPPVFPLPPVVVARPLLSTQGVNQQYTRWDFRQENIDPIWWDIPFFDPTYAGAAITIRLNWASSVAGGVCAWRIGLVSRASGETYDVAPATDHVLDAGSAGGVAILNVSPLAFVPVAAELVAGEKVTMSLRRDGQAAADTIDGNSAFLLGASLEWAP